MVLVPEGWAVRGFSLTKQFIAYLTVVTGASACAPPPPTHPNTKFPYSH